MSLNNLATFLSALGRREEALAAAQEAADLYRDLARARPEAFTPDLAMSLNNLATFLSALGRREEALAAAQEAVDIRRDLARARPEAFTPDLAMSLNNLWSARAGMAALMTGLNIADEEEEKRGFIDQQIVALFLTIGALVVASVAVIALAVAPGGR